MQMAQISWKIANQFNFVHFNVINHTNHTNSNLWNKSVPVRNSLIILVLPEWRIPTTYQWTPNSSHFEVPKWKGATRLGRKRMWLVLLLVLILGPGGQGSYSRSYGSSRPLNLLLCTDLTKSSRSQEV